MNEKERLKQIKEKYELHSTLYLTMKDLDFVFQQAEKLEEIREVFYAENTNVVDGYRKIIEVFEGKEVPKRNKRV